MDNDHRMDRRVNDVHGEVDNEPKKSTSNNNSNSDIESRWIAIESDYRARYPKITVEDVNYTSGEFERMIRRIAKRLNRTPEDVSMEIRNWDKLNREG